MMSATMEAITKAIVMVGKKQITLFWKLEGE